MISFKSTNQGKPKSTKNGEFSNNVTNILNSETTGNIKSENMFNLIRKLQDRKKFNEETQKTREREQSLAKHEEKTNQHGELPPVFNKRLFSSRGAVIITGAARKIMEQNAEILLNESDDRPISKHIVGTMRGVVDGLKLIHKDLDHVKEILSYVITYEKIKAFQYITKRTHEDMLSCYYIVHGSVEATYDVSSTTSNAVHFYEPNIIYTHTSGEYLGLVQPDLLGRHDHSPPATIYTKEDCEFLRIDRKRFHDAIEKINEELCKDKIFFLNRHNTILNTLSKEEKEKLIPGMQRKVFPPNKLVLEQGDLCEYVFFLVSGTTQCYSTVEVPEIGKDCILNLQQLKEGDFFGEECLLEKDCKSICSHLSQTPLTCFKLHRTEFQKLGREHALELIHKNRNIYPTMETLANYGYGHAVWDMQKKIRIRKILLGKNKSAEPVSSINMRPVDEKEAYQENMFKFLNNESLRPRTSPCRVVSKPFGMSNRAKSAVGKKKDKQVRFKELCNTDENNSHELDEAQKVARAIRSNPNLVKMMNSLMKEHIVVRNEFPIKKKVESRDLTFTNQRNKVLANKSKAGWFYASEASTDGPDEVSQPGGKIELSLESNELVKRADMEARSYAKQVQSRRNTIQEDETYHTSIHDAKETAFISMSYNKFRSEFLRRQLKLQKEKQDVKALRHLRKGQENFMSKLKAEQERMANSTNNRDGLPKPRQMWLRGKLLMKKSQAEGDLIEKIHRPMPLNFRSGSSSPNSSVRSTPRSLRLTKHFTFDEEDTNGYHSRNRLMVSNDRLSVRSNSSTERSVSTTPRTPDRKTPSSPLSIASARQARIRKRNSRLTMTLSEHPSSTHNNDANDTSILQTQIVSNQNEENVSE
ncbi:unnamed protein product [Owenia fusiformis]|uniref:Cyclic nucleotide-binding domain-containing protein n=1 Tax=Owenia fusiformis TaxID=6347 RepID=A0A8S4N0P9_OWEFU|nr:unnamed protein product [Owenia fusiformis]